jgi:hypothetical protein
MSFIPYYPEFKQLGHALCQNGNSLYCVKDEYELECTVYYERVVTKHDK